MGRENAGVPAGFVGSGPQPRHALPGSLRILHVGHAADGDVLAVIGGLASDQIARGWDVHVAWPASASGAWALHTEVGATVHHWDAPRERPTAVVTALNSLARIVRAVAPQVVHLHTPYAGLIGRMALRGKVPTLYEPYWWPFETRRSRAVLAWERTARGWTDLTLCNSEHSHRVGEALECLARRSRVSAPGVDTDY
jgi:glycosyl transferase family 4